MDERVFASVLRILGQSGQSMGADRIARELELDGIFLQVRMVRNYLAAMDRRRWTENRGRAGRMLTPAGAGELARIGITEHSSATTGARLDELAFRMDLDPLKRSGNLILNLSRVPVHALPRAIDFIRELGLSAHGFPRQLALGLEGESLCGQKAPYGHVLIGTVCNITLNGVLRSAGIPVQSRFAGLLAMEDHAPRRFQHLIQYDGCTMDPALLFIKSRMTRVIPAVRTGTGTLLAGFREIPAVALTEARRLMALLERMGLGHALLVGQPGRPVLGIPVAPGRAGMVVAAGLNLMAALEESGIEADHQAMAGLFPAEAMLRPAELERRFLTSHRLRQRLAELMDNPPPHREYTHEE